MPRSCLWAEFTGPNGRATVPGCGFSGPFWFNCSDDTPQHLKPIPPCLLRRMAKNNDFFIFPHPPGAGALTSCGVLNGKILRKESAASHKRNSNPTFHIPAWDMRSGMTTRHGFPGREVQGRGFQSSTKLCIIVHAFLTI